MNRTPSTYERDTTIGAIAERIADGVRARARKGKGISHYGSLARIHVTFTLAGGGPGADVTIIGEGETMGGDSADLRTILGGQVCYYETGGKAYVDLEWQEAEDIYEALMRGGDDEDDEDKREEDE